MLKTHSFTGKEELERMLKEAEMTVTKATNSADGGVGNGGKLGRDDSQTDTTMDLFSQNEEAMEVVGPSQTTGTVVMVETYVDHSIDVRGSTELLKK